MPLFEFRCAACGARFEEIVSGDRKPECPKCGSTEAEKLLSGFAVGRGGSGPRPAAPPAPVPT